MINIVINSGYSFFSLRKSLILFLLKKKLKLTIYAPNNIEKIKKSFSNKNLNVLKFKLNENKKSLIHLILNLVTLNNKLLKKNRSINIIFGSYLNLICGLLLFLTSTTTNRPL